MKQVMPFGVSYRVPGKRKARSIAASSLPAARRSASVLEHEGYADVHVFQKVEIVPGYWEAINMDAAL